MIASQPQHESAGQRVTWVGAGANLLLIVCKLIAGILGKSQAMIADAIHSISDFLTDAIVLLGLRFGRKGPDADHHFGHARVETLASAGVGIALLLVAVWVAYQAGMDIHNHESQQPNYLALIGAGLSIVVKEWLYHYTVRVGRAIHSAVVQANAWHHRSDAFSSVAVLLGVAAALIKPEWHILDAFAALLVSFLIGGVGARVLWDALREMIDTAPEAEVVDRIRGCIRGVAGTVDVHDLKVRVVGGLYHVQVHVVVDRDMTVYEGHKISDQVANCLRAEFDQMGPILVHIDPSEETGE